MLACYTSGNIFLADRSNCTEKLGVSAILGSGWMRYIGSLRQLFLLPVCTDVNSAVFNGWSVSSRVSIVVVSVGAVECWIWWFFNDILYWVCSFSYISLAVMSVLLDFLPISSVSTVSSVGFFTLTLAFFVSSFTSV